MPALTATVTRDLDADVALVRARGCLSLGTAAVMRAVLLRCVADRPSAIVVDVSACDAETSAALTVFPAIASSRAGQPEVLVLLCCPDQHFLRDGGRSALGRVPVYDTCAGALAAAEAARAGQPQVSLRAPYSPNAPGQARDVIATACEEWGLAHVRLSAVLIVSELVSNAIRHAHSDVGVEALVRGDFLHLRVLDRSPVPPSVASPEPDESPPSDHGRGLPIVAHLSADWGCVINSDRPGKVVWATLRT